MCRTKVSTRDRQGLGYRRVVSPGVVRLVSPRVLFFSGGVVACPSRLSGVSCCDGYKSAVRELGLPLFAVFGRPFYKFADSGFTFRRNLQRVTDGNTK